MGSPRVYYIRALQCLAHAFAYESNAQLAKLLNEETSIEKLESYINLKKNAMTEKEFYYTAGRAAQCVIEEAYEEGCDPLNASIGGIIEFEYFIGIEKTDED